jgi:hypothetical protein
VAPPSDPLPGGPPRALRALSCAAAVATLFPLLSLSVLNGDWINHGWMLQRVAAGFGESGLPPVLLDVPGWRGDPWFLFYGLGVYVPLAPLAWLLGAPLAIKLGAFALHALLGSRTARLVFRGTGSAGVAACVSTLVLSAVFPLSDLCARGAVVEFFAYELMAVAVVSLALGATEARAHLIVQACCASTVGALAHPPLFLLGALFVLPVAAATAWALGPARLARRQAVACALALALCAGTLALSLAIVLPSLEYLGIQLVGLHHVTVYAVATIDHPLARLSPLPLDLRLGATAVLPRLSAPFHGALAAVLVAAWLTAARTRLPRRVLAAASLGCAALLAALLLSLPLWPSVPLDGVPGVRVSAADAVPSRLLAHIEFAYRLVAAQDLLLLALVALTFARTPERGAVGAQFAGSRAGRVVLGVATAVGLLGSAMESRMLLAAGRLDGASADLMLAEIERPAWPSTFYARGTFAMSRAFAPLGADLPAVGATTRADGRYGRALEVECATTCGVVTDVVPTRFADVRVDGRALPRGDLRASGFPAPLTAPREEQREADRARRLAVVLPAGTHRVTIRLVPFWVRLVSPALVAIAATAVVAQLAAALARRRADAA